jgi:Zn-dependent protease with chaperone function
MGQVLFIAIFAAFFLWDSVPKPWLGEVRPWIVAAVSVGSMAIIWGVATLVVRRQARRLDRTGDLRAVGRSDMAVAASRFVGVAVHAFNVLGLAWLGVVRDAVGNWVLLDELLAALPVLLLFVGGWWSMYPIERRLREAVLLRHLDEGRPVRPMPSRWAFVLSTLRQQAAMTLVPVMAIAAWNELLERGGRDFEFPRWAPPLGLQVLGMVVLLAFMPAALRHIWDTARLGPGPLRDALERMCREQRVRVRELLVWRTHGTVLNGAVMGLTGRLRYILLTDALLESLTRPQVEAVMAHELGHVRRHHMFWLGLGGLGAIMAIAALGRGALLAIQPAWAEQEWAQAAVFLPAFVLGLLAFGLVSRRFEWQADAFAVQHLSGARRGGPAVLIAPEAVYAMAGALGLVARLNHIPLERFGFRHGSIGDRQRRLRALVGQPSDRLHADVHARRAKIVAACVLAVGVLLSLRWGVS